MQVCGQSHNWCFTPPGKSSQYPISASRWFAGVGMDTAGERKETNIACYASD